jgi:hypothetical protein
MGISETQFLDLIFTEDSAAVVKFLSQHGLNASIDSKGIMRIHNPRIAMNVGMDWSKTDYPTRRTQVGFALFGMPSWLSVRYPNLDKRITKRWKAESKG